MPSKKNIFSYLIDTEGVIDALKTSNNSAKTAVINAIQSGEMRILKGVSEEIKSDYPQYYQDFQAIKPKKYEKIRVAETAVAAALMEQYEAPFFGVNPPLRRFEFVALANCHSVTIVSAGRAKSDYSKITNKCSVNGAPVLGISDL